MSVRDELGDRMKAYYEAVPKIKLYRKIPVAIRLDMRAGHSFTRGFKKPFDDVLIKSMQDTTKYLCEHIQGCVFGYTQSDEITLILQDYKTLTTDAWLDYEVQKICSISASMATLAFDKSFRHFAGEYIYNHLNSYSSDEDNRKYIETLRSAVAKGGMFDARCFNIPKEEVTNMIYWRQLDATRNSIQMVGQANFSHGELQNKSCNVIQEMLYTQKNINWNDFYIHYKRVTAVIKTEDGWFIDINMPELKVEDINYVEIFIYCEDGVK